LFGVFISATGVAAIPFTIFPTTSAECSSAHPVVGFDGTNYLVVFGHLNQVYGIRISTAGLVLDSPTGFRISAPDADSGFTPAIAFDGTNYMVAWQTYHNATPDLGTDIAATRISPAGTVLDQHTVFSATSNQSDPAIAFDGTNYFVVWADDRGNTATTSGSDLFGARVTKDGTVLDPSGVAISTADHSQSRPQVDWDGQHYLVVWADRRNAPIDNIIEDDVYAARVSPDGTLLDGPAPSGGIAITSAFSPNSDGPSVSFDGTHHLIVTGCRNPAGQAGAGVWLKRLAVDGTLIDGSASTAGIKLSVPDNLNAVLVASQAASGGESSLLAWVVNGEQAGSIRAIHGLSLFPF
jgi:hypothetical protein